MSDRMELDRRTAERAFGLAHFNLLRRGEDGSLTLSSDHWRLEAAAEGMFRFVAREDDAPPLEIRDEDIERYEWDRLPKQHHRSQIRFTLKNGGLWTFSGDVDTSVLSPKAN